MRQVLPWYLGSLQDMPKPHQSSSGSIIKSLPKQEVKIADSPGHVTTSFGARSRNHHLVTP